MGAKGTYQVQAPVRPTTRPAASSAASRSGANGCPCVSSQADSAASSRRTALPGSEVATTCRCGWIWVPPAGGMWFQVTSPKRPAPVRGSVAARKSRAVAIPETTSDSGASSMSRSCRAPGTSTADISS